MQLPVAPNPRKSPMAQARQVIHEQFERLCFVRHDRMTDSRITDRDGDEVFLRRLDGFKKFLLDLAEDRDAEELMLPQILLQPPHAEIVLRAEKNGMVTVPHQRLVQTVLHVAEEIALRVQPQTR